MAKIDDCLATVTHKLGILANWSMRTVDFHANSTFGWQIPLLSVKGYSSVTTLLFIPTFFLMIIGPAPVAADGTTQILAAICAGIITIFLCVLASCLPWKLQTLSLPIFVVLAASIWLLAGENTELGDGIYRHVLLIYFPIMMTIVTLAVPFAKLLVQKLQRNEQVTNAANKWRRLLEEVELAKPSEQREPEKGVLLKFILVLLEGNRYDGKQTGYWLQLLFFPALAILFAPVDLVFHFGIAAFLLTWGIHFLGRVYRPFQQIWMITRRNTVLGLLPMLAAGLAIVLAALRMAGFSYISIFVDSSHYSTIITFGLSIYIGIWLFEGLIGHNLSVEFLKVIDQGITNSRIEYEMQQEGCDENDDLDLRRRTLQTHGTRFIVTKTTKDGRIVQETYAKASLFKKLAGGDANRKGDAAKFNEVLWIYYLTLDFVVLALVVCAAFWYVNGRETNPIVPLGEQQHLDQLRSLRSSVEGTNENPRDRIVLVSASGGGTRAAIHATAVMQGLAELDALDDAVLFSGVSGGSTAIAGVMLNYEKLTSPFPKSANNNQKEWFEHWERCSELMASSFIDDVVRGSAELRIANNEEVSRLLAESFHHRFPNKSEDAFSSLPTGCIFNTSIAGQDSLQLNSGLLDSIVGGRLILTNVKEAKDAFPLKEFEQTNGLRMPYKVICGDEIPITTAAALSANFPPVFPNAKIEIAANDNIYVTDGGVVDNRGTMSLLFTLRQTLRNIKKRNLPEIHIVIINSSKTSLQYSSDRGVGSIIGSANQLSAQLTADLLNEVETLWKEKTDSEFHVHYIQLPSVFCRDSGLSTHWMLAPEATLRNPADLSQEVVLSGEDVRNLIVELYSSSQREFEAEKPDLSLVREWADEDLRRNWKKLKTQLSNSNN